MKLNIVIEEQEFANGIPSIVQNLLNSLNEECKESKTKLDEIQSELQRVKNDKTSVETEKSKLEEELSQVKSAKDASEKDLNDKLSRANEDLANVRKEKSGVEAEKSKLAEELSQVKSAKDASEKDLNDKLSKANEDLANEQKKNSEIEEAKSKLAEEYSKELEKVEAEKDSLNEKLATAVQTCESLRSELLAHDFSGLLKNLSEEGKSVVNNNFKHAEDFKALLYSMKNNEVEDFYNEVRDRVNNQKSEDIENLKKLAHITCEYYCAGTGCKMIEPNIGEEFSEKTCIEKGSANSSGKISKVLLFGLQNADGTVRNPAMVSIG